MECLDLELDVHVLARYSDGQYHVKYRVPGASHPPIKASPLTAARWDGGSTCQKAMSPCLTVVGLKMVQEAG
jgi:hypothetical protein